MTLTREQHVVYHLEQLVELGYLVDVDEVLRMRRELGIRVPKDLHGLTQNQATVLHFVTEEMRNLRRSPTYAEIAAFCGWKNTSTAYDVVAALARKGFLVVERDTARGISLPGWRDTSYPKTPNPPRQKRKPCP